MFDPTRRQLEALDIIRKSIETRGYPPTIREIAAAMGLRSTNGVNDHLVALERKGLLARDDMKSRGLRPVDAAKPGPSSTRSPLQMVSVCIVDRIRRGVDQPDPDHVVDTLTLSTEMASCARWGFLVKDGELAGLGILAGDCLLLRADLRPTVGKIVAVHENGEAVLRVYKPWLGGDVVATAVGMYRRTR